MKCIAEGVLRARLDQQLPDARMAEVDRHLAQCAGCRARWEALQRQAQWVEAQLGSEAEAIASTSDSAWARWVERTASAAPGPALRVPRWAWVAACAAVLVAVGAIVPATRSMAANVLAMLRVQKVTVVTISPPLLDQPEMQQQMGRMIEQFLTDKLVVTIKPGPPQPVQSAAQAAAMAGFAARLPANDAPARLLVHGEAAFQMTLDRDRVQAIITAAGRSDLQLPAAADGALIAVHIPRSVLAEYGSCPPPNAGKRSAAGFADCVVLHEVPSPTLSVPPNLNLEQMAEIGLQVAGMSAQEAAAFCRTVDWTSTLVIPVPQRESSYRQVPVDGVQGMLIQVTPEGRRPAGYALTWVRQGVIYALTGQGDPTPALNLASEME